MPFWNPIDTPINKFVVEGQLSPGIGTIEKANTPRKWDEVGGYGASGSVLIYHGRKLVPFDGIVKLYTVQDWDEWHAFSQIVERPPNGKIPKALMVWHPWLAFAHVFSAVVTDVLQPRELEQGGHEIVIQFLEYRRPKPSFAKPEAAGKPESTDPVDKYIDQLVGQVQELAK